MAKELSTTYTPSEIEELASTIWNEGNYFHAEPPSNGGKDSDAYTIVIPPPNVTGMLHMGHALNNTLQDIMIRFKRMQGFNTLWMPGTDHAGIATQSVVEKRLNSEQGKTRHDVGRDALVQMIWDWKEEYGNTILEQLKGIGASCDWARTRFTLDETCARAVRKTFYKMFNDRLIYKGKRLVNWDPALQTAVADDEVVHKSVAGNFYYINYPMADGSGVITVATTRPETMLGDTAVAINPKDDRASELLGKMLILPLTDRQIPIIADDHVKRGEGTGCLKVTPAHDPNDYEIGLRHNLEQINILTADGKINENGGQFAGMDRFAARKAVVAALKEQQLLIKIEPKDQEVGHSDRSGAVIEPYLSDQWFVSVKPLAKNAIKAVVDGEVKFHPQRYEKSYLDWLEGIRDWCISRQLWWGHRIPIWSAEIEAEYNDGEITDEINAKIEDMLGSSWKIFNELCGDEAAVQVSEVEDEPNKVRVDICVATENDDIESRLEEAGFARDENVLDTWFSSALWPFSTLGWPEETEELKFYYPTSLLVTSRDIITLWVSRMVMLGIYNIGKIPFSDVFIHGKILDGNGETMSKSKGNGIDPLAIIDTYGADAMRFCMAQMTTESQDMRLPVTKDESGRNISEKFDIGRNFCNKLWNATRFAMLNLEGINYDAFDADKLDITDKWILSRLEYAVTDVTDMLDEFKYNEPITCIYRFFWNDLCDWYLEWAKPRFKDESQRATAQNVLAFVLDQCLRIMHPFMPFITEGLFQSLNEMAPKRGLKGIVDAESSDALIMAKWPAKELEQFRNPDVEEDIIELQAIIKSIREIRSQYNVAPSLKLKGATSAQGDMGELFKENEHLIKQLAGLEEFVVDANVERGKATASSVLGEFEVFVHDVIDAEAEKKRLEKQKETLIKGIKPIEGKLANENFVTRAKPEVVESSRQRLAELKEQLAAVEKLIEEL
ncbi:MAG: valine--tRNA ligase [Sedimentisphaeraceae bacterium JB056]